MRTDPHHLLPLTTKMLPLGLQSLLHSQTPSWEAHCREHLSTPVLSFRQIQTTTSPSKVAVSAMSTPLL